MSVLHAAQVLACTDTTLPQLPSGRLQCIDLPCKTATRLNSTCLYVPSGRSVSNKKYSSDILDWKAAARRSNAHVVVCALHSQQDSYLDPIGWNTAIAHQAFPSILTYPLTAIVSATRPHRVPKWILGVQRVSGCISPR